MTVTTSSTSTMSASYLLFTSVAEATITLRDEALGTITESDLANVTDSYASLTQGEKATARTWAETQRDLAVRNLDISLARAWMTVREALVTQSARPVIDLGPSAVRTAALLRIAAARIAQTFDFDLESVAYVVTESDEAVIERLSKIQGQHGTKAPKGSVQAYVDEAFSTVTPGTFLTVGEITKMSSAPSAGAIAARLFPRDGSDCTLEGVAPQANADGTKQGAVKL